MRNFLVEEETRHLITQLREGNEPAFNGLYQIYSKQLYVKINAIVKDETITDELLQDLFLKVWEKKATLKPEYSFAAFLHTIANNLIYDYFRKVSKDKRLFAVMLVNAVDCYMHTEENLIGKETAAIIQQAINNLTAQRKKVFNLCKIEGKSYQETADILGISVPTVNSHMVKAIKTIKETLHRNQHMGLSLLLCLSLSIINN